MRLPGFQVRYLRSLANNIEPIIRIGKTNITEENINSINTALNDHELLKVKFLSSSTEDKKQAAQIFEKELDCCIVNIVGNIIILYRETTIEEKRIIHLPKNKTDKPKLFDLKKAKPRLSRSKLAQKKSIKPKKKRKK